MNEKKQFDGRLEINGLDQTTNSPYAYAEEWETPDENADLGPEPICTKIVARMPDLGIGGTSENQSGHGYFEASPSDGKTPTGRILLAFFRRISFAFTPRKGGKVPGRWKVNALSTILIFALALCVAGGVFIHKSNKRKNKMAENVSVAEIKETKEIPVKQAAQSSATKEVAKVPEKPATKPPALPAKPADKPAEKPAPPAKPADKPAEKPAPPVKPADKPAEKPATPAKPADKPAEKPATPAKPADKPAEKPAVAAAVPTTPWERSATDAYTPWTMTSPGRLEAVANVPNPNPALTANATVNAAADAAANAAPGFSTTTLTAQVPVQSMMPMRPMMPMPPAPQAYPPGQPAISSSGILPPSYVPTHAYSPVPSAVAPQPYPQQPYQQQQHPQPQYAPQNVPQNVPQRDSYRPQVANGPIAPASQSAIPQNHYGSPHPQQTLPPAYPAQYPTQYPASYPSQGLGAHQTQYRTPYPPYQAATPQQAYQQPGYSRNNQPQYQAGPHQTMPQPARQTVPGVGTVYSQGNAYQQGTFY